MVSDVEFHIMDNDTRDEIDTCEDCVFFDGEECTGHLAGIERYSRSKSCIGFEPILN